MTPDDEHIPEDDAIARAARRALHRLAGQASSEVGTWGDVQSGARRVRQPRMAAAVSAVAILLGVSGAAAAIAGSRNNGTPIAGPKATTTTGSSTSTSTTTTTPPTACTSGTCPVGGGHSGDTTPGAPAGDVPIAQAGDLQGTLTLPETLVADAATPFTATVRNITDHPIRWPFFLNDADDPILGVWTDALDTRNSHAVTFVDLLNLRQDEEYILAAGEEHTFSSEISPAREQIGPALVYVSMLTIDDASYMHVRTHDVIPGVPPVAVTILPPGWTEGQPLDPSQGKWSATMSADATEMHAGDTVEVRASLRNDGDQPQLTEGYGKLAIVCSPYGRDPDGQFIDAVTLERGAERTFAIAFTAPDNFVGPVACTVGIAFYGYANAAPTRPGIDADTVIITVRPNTGPTTTTGPETTTSTTSP